MFEKECVIDEESRTLPQIYSCIGQAAEELQASCSSSIEVFNKKVKKMSQIHKIYQSTMDSIDDEALLTEEEYKRFDNFCQILSNECLAMPRKSKKQCVKS